MTNFEITGSPLQTCRDAAEKLELVFESICPPFDGLCVEAHFKDIGALKSFSKEILSSRYACFCWKMISNAREFDRSEFGSLGRMRLTSERCEIYVDTNPLMLPPYDWAGNEVKVTNVSYTEKHFEPINRADFFPSQQVVEKLGILARKVLGESSSEIKTSSVGASPSRAHNYFLTVPLDKLQPVLKSLFEEFNFSNVTGSFEFHGSGDEIESLIQRNEYSTNNFPAGCWSFNNGYGKTPFALERASFLYPVLNCTRGQLLRVAEQADRFQDHIPQLIIVRKYLPFLLKQTVSPKTQDNYLLISRQKTGFRMFAGFEQYADDDPTIKDFRASATPRLEKLQMGLKRVPHFK
jgi:hypothetical protein